MSEFTRERRWKEFLFGVLAGIAGNYLVESVFGWAQSMNVTIPPMIWLAQIVVSAFAVGWASFRILIE